MGLGRLFSTIVLALLIVATLAGPAFAQNPVRQGYGGQAGGTLGGVHQQGQPSGQPSGGTLPFTGIDLALLVGGGLVLTAVGAGLVRAGTK